MAIRAARHRRINAASLIIHVLLGVMGLVLLLPFGWMVVASTLDLPELFRYPPRLVPGDAFVRNLTQLLQTLPFARAFVNSVQLSVVSTTLQLFFSSLAGYAFAKYQFPAREKLFLMLLATMMIPQAVGLVPWYMMMERFGWMNSYKALVIPGMASAFGTFWMRQYISQSVPDELLQAARIDGCSDFGIYARIVMPVILPGLGALGIMTFMAVWNDYMGPLIILRDTQKYTLPLILALLQNSYGNRLHLVIIGATLATLPVLVVFFLASRRFISGLTAGALKA